ncbi:MAG: ATP-dependent helicase, partial [Candidatus Komeilibacteria bacterium]|nr:ATP-dependent helicase [Candidatus Komeilibacteria bacterium]
RALPYGYTDLWVSTFHSFCQKILQRHGLDIGLTSDFQLVSETEAWLLIRQNLDKFNLNYYKPLGNPTKFIHALVRHFSRAKDELVSAEDYLQLADKKQTHATKAKRKKNNEAEVADRQEAERLREIAEAFRVYQQLLLDNEFLDYGDLINYTLRLFQTRPKILQLYRQQFKYLLVDEFQDTNLAQYELVKLLAAPDNNLTVVGDDDQSIYKFRGASVANILEFKKDFPDAEEIYLQKNYRSGQKILDLAYNFIQLNNPERLEVKLQLPGQKKLSKKLVAENDIEAVADCFSGASLEEEVKWVVAKIIDLFNASPDTQWHDFAILVRSNESAKPFQSLLQVSQVPHFFLASQGLYRQPVIKDIMAVLTLLDDYHESPALWRVLNMPLFGMDENDNIQLSHMASRKSWSLYEALTHVGKDIKLSATGLKQARFILELLQKLTKLSREQSVWTVIDAWLRESGALAALDKADEFSRLENFNYLNTFYKKVKSFTDRQSEPNVKNFVAELKYELESGEEGAIDFDPSLGPETVKIMTVHSAKGLEFKYVFVVNLVDQRFPSVGRREPIELPPELIKEIVPEGDFHLQEERRLFYVAMTRAKEGLWLTAGEDYGGKRKKKPSRFLTECGFTASTISLTGPENFLTLERISAAKKVTKINYQNLMPRYFSFSQISAFQTCPWLYFYQYVLKVPTKGKHQFSYGQSLHEALRRFFSLATERTAAREGNPHGTKGVETFSPVTEEELLTLLDECWIDDWYERKSHEVARRKVARQALSVFYSTLQSGWPAVCAVEKDFSYKLGDFTLRGRIDRIDKLPDGSYGIVDYKTGESKTEAEADQGQLLLYQIAATEVYNLPITRLTYYYIDSGDTVTFCGTPAELIKLKNKLTETLQQITSYDFSQINSHSCHFCKNNRDIRDFIAK